MEGATKKQKGDNHEAEGREEDVYKKIAGEAFYKKGRWGGLQKGKSRSPGLAGICSFL
jgi:hypothetical protein